MPLAHPVDSVRVPLDEQVEEQETAEAPDHDESAGHLPGNVGTSPPSDPPWPAVGPVDVLELWPDYGHSPLWSRRQNEYVEPAELPLPAALAVRLAEWGERYEEDRLPLDGTGDPAYLAEGERLLAEVRTALGSQYRVVVTEPWWGEPEEDEPSPGA